VNSRVPAAALTLALLTLSVISTPTFAQHVKRGISPSTTTAEDPNDPIPLPPPPGTGFTLHF